MRNREFFGIADFSSEHAAAIARAGVEHAQGSLTKADCSWIESPQFLVILLSQLAAVPMLSVTGSAHGWLVEFMQPIWPMKLRIANKFFLALVVTTGLGIAFMALAQRYTFERGLLSYAQEIEFDRLQFVIEELEGRYENAGSWAFVADKEQWLPPVIRSRFGQRLRRRDDALMLGGRDARPRHRMPRDRHSLRELTPPVGPPWWRRISLLDPAGQLIAGAVPADSSTRRELEVNGSVVGYLALAPLDSLSDELDLAFASQQMKAVFWAAVIALLGAVLAAALLARSFGSPIRALARGTHALAGGRYETRLDQSRRDELGRLAVDFNGLAAALQQTREARQQWVADISHELRTPVAVLQAELETLEDGLRPLDRGALRSLSAEVKRLRLLVDDLHQLARSDSGALTFEKARVDLAGLLKDTVDRFHERAAARDLTIEVDIEGAPAVFADADRLRQLVANLMENALRYTDPGGIVRITSAATAESASITIEDSAPGVPDAALSRLFDRLYRVDPSRSRGTGASGLGLAICASIATAHGGTISAAHSALGGLRVTVQLPLFNQFE